MYSFYHPHGGRSLDCLLPKPGLMSQFLTGGVSDVHPTHHDSAETAEPLLGIVNHSPIRVTLQVLSGIVLRELNELFPDLTDE